MDMDQVHLPDPTLEDIHYLQRESEEQLEKARERFEKQCKRKRLVVTESPP